MKLFSALASLLLAGLLFVCPSMHGQQTGISGVVRDTQGATIAGAKVEAKQTGGSSFF